MPKQFQFVACYINRYRHFGQRVTSRVEANHAEIKGYIGSSRGDLKFIIEAIQLMILNKRKEWEASFASAASTTATAEKTPILAELRGHITPTTLKLILSQTAAIQHQNFNPSCSGYFTKSMGLPCAHIIQSRQRASDILHLQDIDPH